MELGPNGPREVFRELDSGVPTLGDFAALRGWHAGEPPPYTSQRVELASEALKWCSSWAPHWREGAMLTLDYGDNFPQLYHRRPAGTLRAYLLHQHLTGPAIYQNMGRQDLTSDVNFTDLQSWGGRWGWTNECIITQGEFLERHLRDFSRRVSANPALAFLTAPQGAGGAFKALVQRVAR